MAKEQKVYIFFFGPIASGKGTQAGILAEKLKLPVVSPGELFRRDIEAKSKIGRQVARIVTGGKLVPDDVTQEIISARLKNKDARGGYILDGFPRNRRQLEFILDKIKGAENKIVLAVHIDVNDREVTKRISGRRVCDCGATYHIAVKPPRVPGICDKCLKKIFQRQDDKPAAIKARLKIFHKDVMPLVDYFRKQGTLLKINGKGNICEIASKLEEKVRARININRDDNI